MIKIYHNPRCQKSRKALQILIESGKEFQVREYLKVLISKEELTSVISLLRLSPIDLVRKGERIWKEKYKDKVLSDDEIIQIMIENLRLIERPIVTHNNLAVVGRQKTSLKLSNFLRFLFTLLLFNKRLTRVL